MHTKTKTHAGFSLVELVIVIVILGIIAAVAIPRITSGSRNASESALRANLKTLRTAIDSYYVEHHNTFPGVKTNGLSTPLRSAPLVISQLINISSARGIITGAAGEELSFGPYIRKRLPNLTVGPNAGTNGLTVVNQATPLSTDLGTGSAWIFNLATGEIIPNADDIASDGTAYSTF
jgi:prepilin-type N-terminal cleavage/methylation domain-containing protein